MRALDEQHAAFAVEHDRPDADDRPIGKLSVRIIVRSITDSPLRFPSP